MTEKGSWTYSFINVEAAQTLYESGNLGHYAWAYMCAPLAAGVAAGIMAKFHFKIFDRDMEDEEGDMSTNSSRNRSRENKTSIQHYEEIMAGGNSKRYM